jgi:hypothetical protein
LLNEHVERAISQPPRSHRHILCQFTTIQPIPFTTLPRGRGAKKGASPSPSVNRAHPPADQPQRTILLTHSGRRQPKLTPRLTMASASRYYPGGRHAGPLSAATPSLRVSRIDPWSKYYLRAPLSPNAGPNRHYFLSTFPRSRSQNPVSRQPVSVRHSYLPFHTNKRPTNHPRAVPTGGGAGGLHQIPDPRRRGGDNAIPESSLPTPEMRLIPPHAAPGHPPGVLAKPLLALRASK